MSKLAIILCVAFFATATSSSFLSDKFHAIRTRVESIVASTISTIKEKFELAKQKALDKLTKLEEDARKFSLKLINDISAEVKKTREKVESIAERAKGIDVKKCIAIVNELDSASAQLYSETSACAVEKVKIGSNYVDNMKENADIVSKRLSELREEGLRCGNNVTSARAALRALACIKLVSAKATWTAAKAIPSITGVFAKIDYLLATIRISLSQCSAPKALVKFSSHAINTIKRVEKCVRQQFAEGKKPSKDETTPPPTSTPITAESSTSDSGKGSTTLDYSSTTNSVSSSEPEVTTAKPSEEGTYKDTITTEPSATNAEKGSTTPDGDGASTSSGQSGENGSSDDPGTSTSKLSEQSTDKDSITESNSATESPAVTASEKVSSADIEISTLEPSEKTESYDLPSKDDLLSESGASTAEPSPQSTDKSASTEKEDTTDSSVSASEKESTTSNVVGTNESSEKLSGEDSTTSYEPSTE